jgi:hypothetical protein
MLHPADVIAADQAVLQLDHAGVGGGAGERGGDVQTIRLGTGPEQRRERFGQRLAQSARAPSDHWSVSSGSVSSQVPIAASVSNLMVITPLFLNGSINSTHPIPTCQRDLRQSR